MTVKELISKVEGAVEGSRELDAEITASLHNAAVKPYPPSDDFGPRDRWQFWSQDGKHFIGSEAKFPVPLYTTSLDAALALIPEECLWLIGHTGLSDGLKLFRGDLWGAKTKPGGFQGLANTAPLALVSACLKARAALREG